MNRAGTTRLTNCFSPALPLMRRSLSALSSCLSPTELDCVCDLSYEIFLQIFKVFYTSKKCLYFIENKMSCFPCFLRLFYIIVTGLSEVLRTKYVFYIENGFWYLLQFCQYQLITANILTYTQYTSVSLFLSPSVSPSLKSATHLSIHLCNTHLAFKILETPNMCTQHYVEKNRIRKGGHHSDPCTSTVIDLLCNPLAQSFSSPAPRTQCSILLTEMSSKSPGFTKWRPRRHHHVTITIKNKLLQKPSHCSSPTLLLLPDPTIRRVRLQYTPKKAFLSHKN
jgi:hypothetical protein